MSRSHVNTLDSSNPYMKTWTCQHTRKNYAHSVNSTARMTLDSFMKPGSWCSEREWWVDGSITSSTL